MAQSLLSELLTGQERNVGHQIPARINVGKGQLFSKEELKGSVKIVHVSTPSINFCATSNSSASRM